MCQVRQMESRSLDRLNSGFTIHLRIVTMFKVRPSTFSFLPQMPTEVISQGRNT